MKCRNCKYKNVTQANFCYRCGCDFTQEEKEQAIHKSFITKWKKIKNIYDTLTLSKITSHIAFKILVIVFILTVGLFLIYKNGNKFLIVESSEYTYEYNVKENEYYLYLTKNECNLNLYLPHEVKSLYITYYNATDDIIAQYTMEDLSKVMIGVNNNGNYYKISYDKNENQNNTIKLYAFKSVGENHE